MTKGSTFILRLYFAVVSAVTLFTLMFGAIDLLTIGLKTYVIRAANVPDYLEPCSANMAYDSAYMSKPIAAPVVEGENGTTATPEQLKAQCEARNEASIEAYKRTQAGQAVRNIALIIISLPLFLVHFKILYKDWMEERKENAEKGEKSKQSKT